MAPEREEMLDRITLLEQRLARIEQLLGWVTRDTPQGMPVPTEPDPILAGDVVEIADLQNQSEENSVVQPDTDASPEGSVWDGIAEAEGASVSSVIEDVILQTESLAESVVVEAEVPDTNPRPTQIEAKRTAPTSFLPGTVEERRLHSARPSDAPQTDRVKQQHTTQQAQYSRTSLELLVGGKWMAWVGALAVVIAVAFFLKLGYDQGWWTSLSAQTRSVLGAVFGLVLLGAGEVCLRRIGKPASVGLFGAGLSVLYLVAWAMCTRFHLVSQQTSFVLMAVVAIVGFALTYRSRFLTIGVLSTLGGYATPLLLSEVSGHDELLLSYMTMLLAMALGLSAVQPTVFRPLRFVSLGAHSIPALVWLADINNTHWTLAIVCISLWWTMVLAECMFAALRDQTWRLNIIATLISTALYVTAGTWILSELQPVGGVRLLGLFTAAVALLGGVAAVQFGPGLDAIRVRPRTPIDKLALSLWAQSAVLVVVAIALQFDGYGQSIGWLAFGLAAIEVSRHLPSRGVAIFGLVVGALAVVRIVSFDWWIEPRLMTPIWIVGKITVNGWSILAVSAVVAAHTAARRLRVPAREPTSAISVWRQTSVVLAVLGTLGWIGITQVQTSGPTTIGVWVVSACVCFGVWRHGIRLRYFEIGVGVLVLTAARWLFDAAESQVPSVAKTIGATPVFNAQMGLAFAIAAAGWWGYSIMQRRAREGVKVGADNDAGSRWIVGITGPAQWTMIVGTVFLLVALSFEVQNTMTQIVSQGSWWSTGQARHLLFTALWTLGGTGLAVVGAATLRGNPQTRSEEMLVHRPYLILGFAWAVLIACGAKWIVFDSLAMTVDLPRSATISVLPVANLQVLVGLLIAAAAMVLSSITLSMVERDDHPARIGAGWVPVAVSLVVLWALSFEIDRLLARTGDSTLWSPALHRGLWWTVLWSIGAVAMQSIGRARSIAAMVRSGWWIVCAAVCAWLGIETIGVRLVNAPFDVMPVLNLQFAAGCASAALLAVATRLRAPGKGDRRRLVALVLIGAVGLWLGSLEIDRAFADRPMGRQTGLSVYWCVYALVLIVLGFARNAPIARYVGIGLFAVTTLKVCLIDLSQVELVWRVVSFLVLGLLLIGTSILYARLAPRLAESAAVHEE